MPTLLKLLLAQGVGMTAGRLRAFAPMLLGFAALFACNKAEEVKIPDLSGPSSVATPTVPISVAPPVGSKPPAPSPSPSPATPTPAPPGQPTPAPNPTPAPPTPPPSAGTCKLPDGVGDSAE